MLRLGALGAMAALAAACGARRPAVGTGTTTSAPRLPATTGATAPKPATTTTAPPPVTTAAGTTVPATTVPATTAPATTVPATTTTSVPPAPTAADWAALSDRLAGRLSLPGASTYRLDLELYNPQYDSVRPAAIAFCANATDVARCIGFARDHGLAVDRPQRGP